MAERPVPERRVYRRNLHRVAIALLWLVPVYIFVLTAVFVHPAFAVGSVPFLLLAYRTFRIGVIASADGVVVRNVLRSRRIPWNEIERFDWGIDSGIGMSPTVQGGGVYLRDGSFVTAKALSPFDPNPDGNPVIRRALAGLNAELDRARAAGAAPRLELDH